MDWWNNGCGEDLLDTKEVTVEKRRPNTSDYRDIDLYVLLDGPKTLGLHTAR